MSLITRNVPLTRRQSEVLSVIQSFIAEHGYAPTTRELGTIVGLLSSSTVHGHLVALRRKGYVIWERGANPVRGSHKPRTLRVLRTDPGGVQTT